MYAAGQAKPLSLIDSLTRYATDICPSRFVRQERPNQGFSPPAARLDLRTSGGIQHVLQSRGAWCSPASWATAATKKEDLRVETCLELQDVIASSIMGLLS
jgi:hypothetical protein